ncbi:MAG: T9SS type A sorting domain-containing protein [Vicingaceae bacterium]
MKKPFIFLVLLIPFFVNSYSQHNINPIEPNQESGIVTNFKNTKIGKHLKPNLNNKALGDTLHYEPFDSLPSGYTIVNFAQNSFVWKWDTLSRVNFPSTSIPRIRSTTGATGYMILPMTSGFSSADTYFESDKITINPKASVLLQYQIYIQTCCSGSDIIAIEVSTDSINWDSYDISFLTNTPNTDTSTAVTFESINLSATLANQSDFWYRVYVSGPSAYFVMLDDFAFIEGPCNDLVLSNSYLEFNNTNYSYNPTYSQIPYDFFPALPFFANIKAEGGCDQTGVGFDIDVNHLNFSGGGPGTGNVYTSLNNIGNLLSLSDTNVISGTPLFTPSVLGDFEVELKASSDSIDQVPSNNSDTWNFSVTDTVFAKDDNDFDGGVGPANYADGATGTPGGTTVGDRFGTMYILENNCSGNSTDNIPTSVTYYVSSNSKNIGVEITPKIWEYNEDSLVSGVNAAFGSEVASSFLGYTVTSSDTNSFLTLNFTTGPAMVNGLDSGQYIVGWEVTNLPTGKTFEVANDVSAALRQQPVTSFLYFGHATSAGWGWVDAYPVIRLNMGNLPGCLTSIIKPNAPNPVHFAVSPNPSNGEFKLTITSEEQAIYNLNVRNMLGQLVYSTQVQVNGTKIERMNLSNLDKGVYFVTLENDSEKLLKKVVLK